MDVKFANLRGLDDYVRVDVTEDGLLLNGEFVPNVIGARLVVDAKRMPCVELRIIVNEYHDSHRTAGNNTVGIPARKEDEPNER